jgi:hypothetical protein
MRFYCLDIEKLETCIRDLVFIIADRGDYFALRSWLVLQVDDANGLGSHSLIQLFMFGLFRVL